MEPSSSFPPLLPAHVPSHHGAVYRRPVPCGFHFPCGPVASRPSTLRGAATCDMVQAWMATPSCSDRDRQPCETFISPGVEFVVPPVRAVSFAQDNDKEDTAELGKAVGNGSGSGSGSRIMSGRRLEVVLPSFNVLPPVASVCLSRYIFIKPSTWFHSIRPDRMWNV